MKLLSAGKKILQVDPETLSKLDELVISHRHLAVLELRKGRIGHADSRRQGAQTQSLGDAGIAKGPVRCVEPVLGDSRSKTRFLSLFRQFRNQLLFQKHLP